MTRARQPGRPMLTIRIPVELRKRLEDAAVREHRTLTNECVHRLERSLQDPSERRQPAQQRAS